MTYAPQLPPTKADCNEKRMLESDHFYEIAQFYDGHPAVALVPKGNAHINCHDVFVYEGEAPRRVHLCDPNRYMIKE